MLCIYLPDKSMVLKHHPDKRKAAGEQIGEGDNDYFTCITKGKSLTSFMRFVSVATFKELYKAKDVLFCFGKLFYQQPSLKCNFSLGGGSMEIQLTNLCHLVTMQNLL